MYAGKPSEQGLVPASRAGREVLIRRLSFNLRGLPPSPEEIETFIDDCGLEMDFIKRASLYEFGVALKACYVEHEKAKGH